MNQKYIIQLLTVLMACALVVLTACDAQGPVKKSTKESSTEQVDASDKDASNQSDAAASDDEKSSNDADSSMAMDGGDDEESANDHDADDHDHDGHDHDHDHDHSDVRSVNDADDEPEIMAASPDDFTMNLNALNSDDIVDPSEVIDAASLGIPLHESGVKSSTAKQAYEDLIYGNIRIRMDSSIALRRAMLEQGVAPTDPGVRDLEGQILKAKSLLEQSGESVDPILPPIQ